MTDIEIAQAAVPLPITEVAAKAGIDEAICTVRAEQLASGIISVGLAAMLCVWVKYLSSQPVRLLFYNK